MGEETSKAGKTRRTGVVKIGVVVSDRMQKTIVVKVERTVGHASYQRYVRRSAKFMAHDEHRSARVGDTVQIVECRPLSAQKRWRLGRIVRRAVAGLHDDAPEGAAPRDGKGIGP